MCPIREQDGQASGGNDFGSDDWIFTIREKDPKKLQNGEGQSGATEKVGKSRNAVLERNYATWSWCNAGMEK